MSGRGVFSCEFVGGPMDGEQFTQPAKGRIPCLEMHALDRTGIVHVYTLGMTTRHYGNRAVNAADQRGHTCNYLHTPPATPAPERTEP